MDLPTTRYARTATGDSIAYQVVGSGPIDIVWVPGFASHVELFWTDPAIRDFYLRLASFSRLILFDKRGTGLSDPLPGPQPARIPDARMVELAGRDHAPWHGDSAAYLGEIEEFLTGVREHSRPTRVLATVLFTDLVGSTERAAAVGDTAWRHLVAPAHRRRDPCDLRRPGPGDPLRAGDREGDARRSRPGRPRRHPQRGGRARRRVRARTLVSNTVRELVLGSGIAFDDRGEHELKGVPGRWRLYAAAVPSGG